MVSSLLLGGLLLSLAAPPPRLPRDRAEMLAWEEAAYRTALARLRREYGGTRSLPAVRFFLFGMGSRTKFVYRNGKLTEALTGRTVREWRVTSERIVPSAYTVELRTADGGVVVLFEDEAAVWLEVDGKKEALSRGPIKLPRVSEDAGNDAGYEPVRRVLLQEILVNVVDGRPVPNLFVYPKPWYRDAAMMAMVLKETDNLHLIRDWVEGLRDPFDRNNGGETEADNPGQLLYLISLVSDRNHPAVPAAVQALKRFEKDGYILGRSDFAPHPVYQTRWAKFGLASLGLPDPYTVPRLRDSYATLFWWDGAARDPVKQPVIDSDDYPYLTWAGCHTTGEKKGKLSDRDYPLTWEARASQARYDGMRRVAAEYAERKLCAPHTWHAAEMYLSLGTKRK